ncbi:glutamine and serine-rich protein 1 [Mus musculus]|uniref:Glutamine and serine-rich protein 1 n=2 Tax=Mus musculus TaxID=10090 RepID=QSER1_MOUSE|nr:glutamine and serine-rich protein 1 [Mus musculus]A0A338P6K9.1 RecName: Full=Glutamine and serine-rich protein 1 [Mus musculus]|eukprot:XP_006500521.1 PREDICTED: glutamine and serine-rich protein 1 isoform X1 [Mus musculus]
MDAHYAPAGFAEPPAPPASAATQPAAPAWAYEARVPAAASSPSCSGSSPSLKASYEDGHPSQSESDVLQRQTFTASHQLPGYATTPQATGMHSSAATELFVAGPLPTTGTLPPPTLSAYQHSSTFSNRNFATTSPLVLQDSSFNTTSNGILSPHDPLLQIKTSQGTVPTALAFERLGSSALSNSVPPQSSTYRSAQESAPHLLQPQFSLLPSTLGGAQQTPQAYNSALFPSSAASIERALLRECSVIKHHQRPSVTQSIQAQLTGSQHPLHSYLSSASIGNFQEPSRQSSLSCSSVRDSTQVSNGVLPQKTPQVSAELAQSYSSVIPSSGYLPSATKVDSCSTKQPLTSTTIPKPQSVIPPVQTLNYSKPLHNQSSVISGQAQIYSTAQLPSLLSVSQSQNYGLVQPHNVPSIVHSQVYRSSRVEKLPSLYKTLTFSGSSQPVTSENQTLSYSSNQQEVLSLVTNENYPAQTRDLPSVSESQNYSSGQSQGLSPVSQTQVSYSSQSQVLSVVSPSESYASGQSLTLTAPSLSYSSASRGQSLPVSTPTPSYTSMHPSPNAQTQGSSAQPQEFLPAVQSSFASSTRGQTLQSSIPSPDPKSYAERKLDSSVYTSSKQDEFPVQKLQALQSQASLESSSQRLPDGEVNAQESVYKTSKADDRYSQSVTRNNSHLEDQVVGVALQGSEQEENMVGSMTQLNQQSGQSNNAVATDLKKATNLMQTPQVRLNTKDLNQQHSLMHKMHEAKVQQQHDQIMSASSQIQIPNPALGQSHQALPHTSVLLDSACDLQILQQAGILQASLGQAKASLQVQRVQSPQQIVHPFLQMDGHIIQSNGEHPQQQLHPHNSDIMKLDLPEPSKPLQQLTTKGPFSEANPHDSKNQFVSLGSICFSEAMLLSDERNILSNVDDILAATAAACGVTPSDFSKSAANETMQDIESSDSKSHYQQSLNVRHVNSDFNSIAASVGKPQSINDISLNGNQVSVSLSSVPTLQSETVLDQPHMETPSQTIPTKVPSAMVGLGQEIQEQSSDPFKKQLTINHESKEDREIAVDSALSNNRNQEFVSNSRSISGDSVVSERDFTLVGDDTGVLVNPRRSTLALLAMPQPGDAASGKTEDEKQDVTYFNLPKEKAKGKEQGKEEEDNQKQLKRSAQCKRQNPRGTDVYVPYTSPSLESCDEGFQHQEKMRQKIKEVEEKQPEVKTGFIASFLDFLKCGPKQQFSTLAVRVPNRTRRSGIQTTRTFCPPPFAKTSPAAQAPSETGGVSLSEKVDSELKTLEQLSSFSSDEEDPGSCGHDIYKNTSAPLTVLDATSDKTKKTVLEALPVATPGASAETAGVAPTASTAVATIKQDLHLTSLTVNTMENANSTESPTAIELDSLPSDQLAKGQDTVAIEGFTDEENIESGGEGQYRERDEFVVKIEDIETFKEALNTGKEPPAIWKVQKALLQKFVPEIRDGQREFAATNSYLGYFGDAKTKYKRIYVKFIENANKKEYVRVCSKKPRNKPSQTIRNIPSKPSSISKTSDPPVSKTTTTKTPSTKPKAKQLKIKAEPPPKKRKKWKEEFSSSQSESSPEVRSSSSEDEGFEPPAPSVTRFLNTRAMKETFKSYMELLVSIALDPDTMQALEKSNDELLLPHMKKIDGMLNDNRKRLLVNLHLDQPFKNALESFPELTVITRDSKAKSGGSAISKIKMNGKAYNKKTLRTSKTTTKSAQEFAVDPEKIQLYSLYHSLHHYKYHVYLICKNEISSVQKKNEDLGQEEIVQLCMKNVKWVEDLFEKFGELLNHVQQKCS